MMISNENLHNIPFVDRWKSVYQAAVSENYPEKKGALEKFIEYVRDQAEDVQETIYYNSYNRFLTISKQILDKSNKTKAQVALKKAEVITRYNDFLEHVQSQLDCLA
jgi:hypothetical protein